MIMKVLSLEEFIAEKPLIDKPLCISIGVFDGMHLGHCSVVKTAVEEAEKLNAGCMVITFDSNPKPGKPEKRLTTLFQNMELFETMGVSYVAVIDFSPEIAKLSGEAFLSAVKNSCRCREIVVGSDFKCGNPSTQLGSAELGRYLGTDARTVIVPDIVTPDGKIISSTLIRGLLQKGLVSDVCACLGRFYELEADVPFLRLNNELLYTSCSLKNLLPCSGFYVADVVDIGKKMIRVTEDGNLAVPSECTGARRIRLLKESENGL